MSESEKILLELMYDFIEKILTDREMEIFSMYKANTKPRHIAETLNISSKTVRNRVCEIKKKIKKHEEWLEEKSKLRGIRL